MALALRPSSVSLWQEAVGRLPEALSSQTDFFQQNMYLAPESLLVTVKEAQKRAEERSWSFKRKSGEVVFVRNVLAKVAKWIDRFKQIGDIAVQYDPVHAALPWAGVRFILEVAVGDLTTYAEVLERTADIAEYICRNALVETMLGDAQAPAREELRHALIKLYASIITYLCKAREYYDQKTMKRVLKSAISMSPLDTAFTEIEALQKDVDRCTQLAGWEDQVEIREDLHCLLQDFNTAVPRFDERLADIDDHIQAEKRLKILRWISEEPYMQHHKLAKSEVLKGTGAWLLQDPIYRLWKDESASSVLWLHGIPGSGKSKLVSIVIEERMKDFQQKRTSAPAIFYCSRNPAEPGRSDPTQILASVARQLSTPNEGGPLLGAIVDEYQKHERQGFSSGTSGALMLDEITDLILQLLQQYKNAEVTIILDALDECNESTRASLISALEDVLNGSPCLLKIFISSRDDQDIVCQMRHYPSLELSSKRNTEDIKRFIEAEVAKLRSPRLASSFIDENLGKEIVRELTSKACGMFRLASLQVDELRRHRTKEGIHERLGRLPRTLADMYQEILAQINQAEADIEKHLARSALTWLLHSWTQLSAGDFLAMISSRRQGSTPISPDQLLHLCRNLVVYDVSADVFRFSHLSVREFLEGRESYNTTSSNTLMAEACLAQLTTLTRSNSEELLDLHNVQYACKYWAVHAQEAGIKGRIQLGSMLRGFLPLHPPQDSPFTIWYEWLIHDRTMWDARLQTLPDLPSVLMVICAFDLSHIFNQQEWASMADGSMGMATCPTWQEVVVGYGSGHLLEWLFDNGFSVPMTTKTLQSAAQNAWSGDKVMAMLLEKDSNALGITEEVVKAAAENMVCGDKLMAILLEKYGGALEITEDIVEAAVGNPCTAAEILELLLDRIGDRVTITEDIIIAAMKQHDGAEILELLLDRKGHQVIITEDIVKAAVENTWTAAEILELLLDRIGDPVTITKDIVKAAVGNRDAVKVMTLLLDRRGDQVTITEDIVKAAVGNRDAVKVMTLLLDRKGDQVTITEDIIMAAMKQHDGAEILELLLDRKGHQVIITEDAIKAAAGIRKNGVDQKGDEFTITEDIVMAAMGSGVNGVKILMLLLDRKGYQVIITEDAIKAVAGIRKNGVEVLTLLLDRKGVELTITEDIVKTAVRNEWAGLGILRFLLDRKGDQVTITKDIVNAAATNQVGGLWILKLLLDRRGHQVTITEDVVKAAARNQTCGNQILKLLLDRRGHQVTMTEDIVNAAAGNPGDGAKILKLLEGYFGSEKIQGFLDGKGE